MTAGTRTPRLVPTSFEPIPMRRRLWGLGSIYGKTIRDARLAFGIAAGLLGGMALVMGVAVSSVFPTPAARLEVDRLITGLPASMVDLFGKPVDLGTLGGYLTYKYGAIFALGTALWSIVALSSTLAGEARRGSLDLVAVTPLGKRSIALQKVAAHLTLLGLALAVLAVATTLSASLFGDAALGDAISPLEAFGFALWVGCIALCFGGLAFALSAIVGRGGAAGIATLVMLVLWLANGVDGLGVLAPLSPFRWTADHIALTGRFDWPPVVLSLLLGAAFLVIGIWLFQRRDLGAVDALRIPVLPGAVLGVRGPTSRAFGELLPRALAWGVGLGLIGAMLASLAGSLTSQLGQDTNLLHVLGTLFPGVDLRTAGGFLQLYIEMLYIAAGFAGATFVARWASDETEGRLGQLLSTPMTRRTWVVAGGVASALACLVVTLLFATGIALGASASGVAVGDALLASAALGLYAFAIVGVGVAVGGVWRTSAAAEVAALVVVTTYLIDLVAPPLGLPDPVHELALTAHLGQPMVGAWDPVGVVACVIVGVGGILLGAWGVARRDLA